MATNLHRVYENFVWLIKGLSPTSGRDSGEFRPVTSFDPSPDESSGKTRCFTVERMGRGADDELTSMHNRWAWHEYAVEIYYSGHLGRDARHEVMDQDTHDVIKALRDPSGWDGYSDAAPSTDIGIENRQHIGEEIRKEGHAWITRLTFNVLIKEQEA